MGQPAVWIKEDDRVPYTLVENFYTEPLQNYQGWSLVNGSRRVGVYRKDNEYIVVCKGTTPTNPLDIFDDARIGHLLSGSQSIDQEVRQVVSRIPVSGHIRITGHSLGGRAALTIAYERKLEAVVFNPAAPFLNPISKGPGPAKATAYHISGDLISSSISPEAAEVIRVDQGYTPFQVLDAHSLKTFKNDVPTFGFHSIDQEDVYIYSTLALALWSYGDFESFKRARKVYGRIASYPLPGSSRSKSNGPDAALMQYGDNFMYFISRTDAYDTNVRILQSTFKLKETGFLPKGLKYLTTSVRFASAAEDLYVDLTKLAKSVSGLQFVSIYNDYQTVQAGVDELSRISGHKLKASDILYTKNENVLFGEELYESIELQKLGLDDEVISKILFSPKSPEPREFLIESARALPRLSAELSQLQHGRLNTIRAKEIFKHNPFSKTNLKAIVRGGVITEETIRLTVKGATVAKTFLLRLAGIAGRVTATVFETLVPILAAADLAYTVFLLGKGLYEGDISELVEYTTGLDKETLQKDIDLIKKGPIEYWRPFFEEIKPSCERCPPGSALYWNGVTCARNPCGTKNGRWGIYNKETNDCDYSGPETYLSDDYWDIPVVDLDGGLKEQDEAVKKFKDGEAEYKKYTESAGWWDVTAPLKDVYKRAYAWEGECPK